MLYHALQWILNGALFGAFDMPVQVAERSHTAEALLVKLRPLWEESLTVSACQMLSLSITFEHVIMRFLAVLTLLSPQLHSDNPWPFKNRLSKNLRAIV